uniref:hypothetical protein n=1 Tax=Candidatus Electronema sp. TaxID=2698783 RepID=UPI0040578100
MRASRIVLAALSLLLVAATAQNVFAQRRWLAKEEVEAGGWHVAYGRELTEREAERGEVDFHVSLHRSDRETLRTWADSLLRQAVAMMVHDLGPWAADGFSRDEQREARRFGIETIRDLLGSKVAGAQILLTGPVEFKAGVIEYRDRSSEYRRHREVYFMPYFALRLKPGRRHHRSDRSDFRDDHNRWRDRGHDDRRDWHYRSY